MRRTALLTLSLPALLMASAAQAVTFYLHRSGSPVPVPGGTTTFLLDQSAPVAPSASRSASRAHGSNPLP